MLRSNKWVDECLESVANNSSALWTDKYLVSWIRLIKITEEIGSAFSFEDPSNMADLSEPRVQLIQSGFGKMLDAWKESVGTDINGKYSSDCMNFHSNKKQMRSGYSIVTRNFFFMKYLYMMMTPPKISYLRSIYAKSFLSTLFLE